MKNPTVTALTALLLVLVGCATTAKDSSLAARRNHAQLQDRELELIDLVLSDLTRWYVFSDTGTHIIVHHETRQATATLDERVLAYGDRVQKLPRRIQLDIVKQNQIRARLSSWDPSSPNLTVADLSPLVTPRRYTTIKALRKQFPKAKGYVQVWRPGFSRDGDAALLRLRIGVSRLGKGGVANYMLHRTDGAWTIEWRVLTRSKFPWER